MSNTTIKNSRIKLPARPVRENRNKEAEKLWEYALEANQLNGHHFIRNFPIEESSVDFICRELKLVIEIGQKTEASENTINYKKLLFIENKGYKVLMYSESEIILNIDDVVSDIFYIAENLADYRIDKRIA